MLGAGIDLAFARDSSALVVVDGDPDGVRVVAMEEVRGGPASDPRVVVAAFASRLKELRIAEVMADTHYRSLLVPELAEVGVTCRPAPTSPVESYLHFGRELMARRVRIPSHPLRARLIKQLRETRRKPLPSGAMTIVHGRKGGGHGDIAAALVLAVWMLRPGTDSDVLRVPARTASLMGQPAAGWADTPDEADERDDAEEFSATARLSDRWGKLPDRWA